MEKYLHAQAVEILAKIEAGNDAQDCKASTEAYLNADGEFVIKLNSVAAVELCKAIMELVIADIDGKHQHFDKHNFVDEGSGKFAIIYLG